MECLGLEWNRHLGIRSFQSIEPEQVAALFIDADEAIASGGGAAGGITPTACSKAGTISRVVSRLTDDDRVLAGFEHTRAVRMMPESRLQR